MTILIVTNIHTMSTEKSKAIKDIPDELADVVEGPIDPAKTVADVRATPYSLPDGFEWIDIDLTCDTVANECYTLLTENYVEDDDNMFRFDYSVAFLRWALLPPGYVHASLYCL
jgi:glycylpeptide N-tetradecanoyltransferase